MGLVSPYSLTFPGGVQGQVLGLARALRAQGHAVQVLAPCDGAPPDLGVSPLGRSVPFAGNGSVAPLAPDPACVLRTLRALGDEDFDVVHLHEPLCPGPTLVALAVSRAAMVGTFHRCGQSTAYRVLRPFARLLGRRLAVRCAVSEEAAATARFAVGGEFEVVGNGIEVERFAKATPWPSPGRTVFFLGRHEPRKGLAVLLDAMAELPPDVHLWVAGTGSQTEQLRHRTSGDERIEWLGRIDDEEAAARLRAADVFCAPSRHGESFGVVLLEAMAAATPVVASDLPGYRTVAEHATHALLVPPDDATSLAAALRAVLDDPALASRLSDAGEGRAAEYAMDKLAERYVALYERARALTPAAARRRGGAGT